MIHTQTCNLHCQLAFLFTLWNYLNNLVTSEIINLASEIEFCLKKTKIIYQAKEQQNNGYHGS